MGDCGGDVPGGDAVAWSGHPRHRRFLPGTHHFRLLMVQLGIPGDSVRATDNESGHIQNRGYLVRPVPVGHGGYLSARMIRRPRLTGTSPQPLAWTISCSSKPPSGPMNRLMRRVSRPFRASRSPVAFSPSQGSLALTAGGSVPTAPPPPGQPFSSGDNGCGPNFPALSVWNGGIS